MHLFTGLALFTGGYVQIIEACIIQVCQALLPEDEELTVQ